MLNGLKRPGVESDVLPSIVAALADELKGFQLPQSPLGDGE
jgi:hypothetical protein